MPKAKTKEKNNDMTRYEDLDDYLSEDDSFPTAFLRAVGAIASSNGKVSLSEYEALKDIAILSGDSAVAGAVLHNALENPIPITTAFESLEKASICVKLELKKACFEAARPLLSLQGPETKDITNKLAKSLGYKVTEEDVDELCLAPDATMWESITKYTKPFRPKGVVDYAEECYKVSRDKKILEMVRDYENGKIDAGKLRGEIICQCQDIQNQIEDYEKSLNNAVAMEKAAKLFISTVRELDKQVSQRADTFSARISFEKNWFSEDIDDAVHDAGNAVELEIQERLRTDQWKKVDVWKSISRTTFSKELELRLQRIVSRRKEILDIYYAELMIFQNELKVSQANILKRVNHSQYAKYMPDLRYTTRFKNAADDIAKFTLWGGALTVAGTGSLVYMLGATVVFSVVAPAVPFIGGAVIVAGIIKWFSNPELRKAEEIRHKRAEFENVLRQELSKAQLSFDSQLDVLDEEFMKSKEQVIRSLLLEAEAAERLEGMQLEIAKRLIRNSRSATTRLITKLSALPA